jgi:hypothetical protein
METKYYHGQVRGMLLAEHGYIDFTSIFLKGLNACMRSARLFQVIEAPASPFNSYVLNPFGVKIEAVSLLNLALI